MAGRLVIALGFAVFIAAAQITIPESVRAQTENTSATGKHGDQFIDNDGDGYNDNAPAGDNKSAQSNKGKRFIDEDGDGISDIAPGLKRGSVQGGSGADRNKSGNASQGTAADGKGIQNAMQNGLKTGQTGEKSNGLMNALERGRKMGQPSKIDQTSQPDQSKNNDAGVAGDSKNRYGREYLNNNKNFSNEKKDMKEDKGKSGTKK